MARYADPLVRSVHAWKTAWRHSELLSVDLDQRLVVFDTRPRAAAPLSVLTGEDRELYLACDGVTDASQLDHSSAGRLKSIADRGLMLNDGARYLSLAIPLGDYRPSGEASERLQRMFSAIGTRDRVGLRIQLDDRHERTGRSRRGARSAHAVKRRRLAREDFILRGSNELYVRRSVS